MSRTLTDSLTSAWLARAEREAHFLHHAAKAPALFKPEAVEQARRSYGEALHTAEGWADQ